MGNINQQLLEWKNQLNSYHIPRWEELPDIDLYMDQVVTLIEKHLNQFCVSDSNKVITPSMINNYVKLRMIPPPIKKKYTKEHLAYLIAISFLKQVLTITQVRDGILQQSKSMGTKCAFNTFCQEQESALTCIFAQIDATDLTPMFSQERPVRNLGLKCATMAFANKILAEKIVELQNNHDENQLA